MKPTADQIRAEAVYRVDARHRGFVPPAPDMLNREYDREELRVRSLARRYPWDRVVSSAHPVSKAATTT